MPIIWNPKRKDLIMKNALIALLLIEGLVMAGGLYYQVIEYNHTIQVDAAEEK